MKIHTWLKETLHWGAWRRKKDPTMPISFREAVEEELASIGYELPKHAEKEGLQPRWDISLKQVSDPKELLAQWKLLDLEELYIEVAYAHVPLVRYLRLFKARCDLSPVAKRAIEVASETQFFRKLQAQHDPAELSGLDQPTSTPDELLAKLNVLINSGQCLYYFRAFPRNRLRGCTIQLAKSFRGIGPDKTIGNPKLADDLRHLNRLMIEELFPDQIRRKEAQELENLYSRIHEAKGNLSALCLSGGGIRSATFALGILQGLARRKLLPEFHYLSTVSGGGYIGGWLTAWLHHEGHHTEQILKDLRYNQPKSPVEPEPKEVVHLREYSNYLAPKLGLFSADSWVLIATYLRNLSLNWLVLAPFLLAACTIPRIYFSILNSRPPATIMGLFLWVGLLMAILGVAYAAFAHPGAASTMAAPNRPETDKAKEFLRFEGQPQFLWFCFLPTMLSAVLLTTFWLWYHFSGVFFESPIILWKGESSKPDLRNYILLGTVLHALGWLGGQAWLVFRASRLVRLRWPVVEVGTGALGGLLLWVAARICYPYMPRGVAEDTGLFLYAAFAVPGYVLVYLLAGTLFVGASSRRAPDEDREWWARMGAWLLIGLSLWLLVNGWVLMGPILSHDIARGLLPAVGGLSGLVTLILSHSGATEAQPKSNQEQDWRAVVSGYAVQAAAPLFVACLAAAFSLFLGHLIHALVIHRGMWPDLVQQFMGEVCFEDASPWTKQGYIAVLLWTPWSLAFRVMLFLVVVGLVMSWLINLNRFSLHYVYRNRLVRAYLGASNPRRRPNYFTGFDEGDNVALAELRDKAKGRGQRPFHIINMALNLVSGGKLAWQQRKADTFTASRLHCGNYRLGFRPSKQYAGSENRRGLTLGTAITISGAAANSNMGYHSSPVICFLMTLFNIRLGSWLGNPGPAGQRSFEKGSPSIPAYYLAKEAFGLSDETSPFVFLSDGGHFENLGLYEMVLRRCKLIVVCDAGCDPHCELEDLGNAIRKIRADLGVRIEIDRFNIYSREDKRYEALDKDEIGKYCAIGKIYYPAQNGSPEQPPGTLLYIKPAICGAEPKDVLNYKAVNKTFPHETTGDQFFSESQFESYRALGLHIILNRICKEEPKGGDLLGDLMRQAQDYLDGPPEKMPDALQTALKPVGVN
jgi:hypothetical protein